jgi:carboxyl-terminal processing protease
VKRLFDKRKTLQTLFTVIVVISISVTAVFGAFFVSNYNSLTRMLEVGVLIKSEYLKDVPVNQLLKGAVRGMVESLNDPYSTYMDKEEYKEFRQHIEGSIGGIGVFVSSKDGKYLVYSVIENTPAYKAGILKGDTIFKVNDQLTRKMDADQVVAKMRGEPGTEVSITVVRGGNIKEFKMTRAVIDIPSVQSTVLKDNIGYLQLSLFASNSDSALVEHLNKLKKQKIKGLILDLRDNPGGDLDSAVNIARYFVPEGPVVYVVDKKGVVNIMSNDKPVKLGVPLVVLINGGSASASEVLSGAIKDTKSGTLVGERSFGKALVQILKPLGGGDAIKLTTAKYLTPNKHDIQAKGIEPDIKVVLKESDKEDVQLNKAIEVLKEKMK